MTPATAADASDARRSLRLSRPMPRGVVVTLAPEWWNLVGIIGNVRQACALWGERQDPTGGDPADGTRDDVLGVAGELAAMLDLNLGWTGILSRRKGQPDLGKRLQVRATGCPTGHLIVQPADSPSDPFVLAIIEPPTVRLVGWMLGREAKVDGYRRRNRNGEPVWWVKQADLRPYSRAVLRWLDAAK